MLSTSSRKLSFNEIIISYGTLTKQDYSIFMNMKFNLEKNKLNPKYLIFNIYGVDNNENKYKLDINELDSLRQVDSKLYAKTIFI